MAMSAIVNEPRQPVPAARYRTLIAERSVVISVITVSELRYGAIIAGWGQLRIRALERDLGGVTAVQADDDLASICATLKANCRTEGHGLWHKVHDADRWIAATALSRGLDLISDDRVFVGTPGLSLLTTRSS